MKMVTGTSLQTWTHLDPPQHEENIVDDIVATIVDIVEEGAETEGAGQGVDFGDNDE